MDRIVERDQVSIDPERGDWIWHWKDRSNPSGSVLDPNSSILEMKLINFSCYRSVTDSSVICITTRDSLIGPFGLGSDPDSECLIRAN